MRLLAIADIRRESGRSDCHHRPQVAFKFGHPIRALLVFRTRFRYGVRDGNTIGIC